jgi:hypothetical protein
VLGGQPIRQLVSMLFFEKQIELIAESGLD